MAKQYDEEFGETPCGGGQIVEISPDICAGITNYLLDTSEVIVEEDKKFSNRGLIYTFAFIATLGVMHTLSKSLMEGNDGANPYEILFVRGVVSVVISVVYLLIKGTPMFNIPPEKYSIVGMGAVVGFLSLCGLYASLKILTITDAFALDSLSVLVALFIDYVFFKATLKFSQFVGSICAIAGIVFLSRPEYLFNTTEGEGERVYFAYGLVAGLAGAFFAGAYSGIIRRTCAKTPTTITFLYRQIATVLFSPIATYICYVLEGPSVKLDAYSLIMMVVIGVLGWSSSMFLHCAIEEEKIATRVYPFKYILIVVGIFLDIFYFRTPEKYPSELVKSTYIGLLLIGINFLSTLYHLFCAKA